MLGLFDTTVDLLQNLTAGYGNNSTDQQQQQWRLYSALIQKQQQQKQQHQQQLELAVQLAVEQLAAGCGSNNSAAATTIFSPSSTCSLMTLGSLSSSSVSPSASDATAAASPTAVAPLVGAQIFGGASLPYQQQSQQSQTPNQQHQQQHIYKMCGERKRRRLVGNLDNTLDGLVAKRVDSDPQTGGLRRYRTEKEAIELPDDEAEMRRMAADPDVSTRQCSVCGYQGKWVSEMIRHKRVHTSERPFRCRLCNRTSKWKADLIRHVAKTHGIRVVSKYSRSKAFAAGANSNDSNANIENNIIDENNNSDNNNNSVDAEEFVFVDENNSNKTASDLADCVSSSDHCAGSPATAGAALSVEVDLEAGASASAAPASAAVDHQQQILTSLASTILQQQQQQQQQRQEQQKQYWLNAVLQEQQKQQQQQLRLSLLLDRQSEPQLALGGLYSQLLALASQQRQQQQ